MNTQHASHATDHTRRYRPGGQPASHRWEDDIERAWSDSPDHGPGLWKVGLWLGQDILAFLLARKPWHHRIWSDEL